MAKNPPSGEAKIEVLERHDPDEDGVTDGDPSFEFAIDESTLPPDVHPVWVKRSDNPNLDDVAVYKGNRFVEVRGEHGIKLKSGAVFEPGQIVHVRDHILMVRDKAVHNGRIAREQAKNRELRARMLNPKVMNKTTYVKGDADGPRAMQQR